MADEAFLEFVKSIDGSLKALNLSLTKIITDHQIQDDLKHETIDKRLVSFEKFRVTMIVWTAGAVLGGGAIGAKQLGFLDKIISALGGS